MCLVKSLIALATGARGADIFRDPLNHATAAASILKYSASVHYVDLELKGGFENLQEEIKAKYPIGDQASIARQIRYAIPITNKDSNLKWWEISLVLIRRPKDTSPGTTFIVELISLKLVHETAANGDVQIPAQHPFMQTERYLVNEGFLQTNADTLANTIGLTTINEFGRYFKSRDI
ncbi:hypothetical protein BGZ73_002579 [Actinomortierella ambigua]|nr:hypothetical protein BGZ73_002579 [Actinomortierella ambigua]